jgi:hypothetical protein
MAFNVGTRSKDVFKQLKKLTPRQRVDYVNRFDQGPATILTMLTPAQFAELFPNYFRKGLPDVSGFRDAISKRSLQKQDDINFGLAQGAKDIKQAEQMGTWRRRLGGGGSTESVTSSAGGPVTLPTSSRGKYSVQQAAALARSVGATPEEAQFLGAVTRGESTGDPRRHNPNAATGDDSYGLWQVNMIGTMGQRRLKQFGLSRYEDLYDPRTNAKAALVILREQGRSAWGAYRDMRRRGEWDAAFAAAAGGINGNVDMPKTAKDLESVSQKSYKSGGVYGNGECVSLSKHFSDLGPASQWKFKQGAAIAPGSIIATTSYGKGEHPGGVHHDQTPDKKSHYHTGVALTAPNSNGDVLILEQFVGQPARVAMVNINNYRGSGERMAVVEGGEPTAKSMQAVELGRGLANPDQLAWIQSGGAASAPAEGEPGKPNVEVRPVQEAPTPIAKPTAVSTEQQQQYPADQQQLQETANKQTAKVEKVDKSKKTFDSYKFDPEKYYNEVNTKHPEAKFFGYDKNRIMGDTYKGFEEAQAAGAIKWNKKTNEIQILDPNHEKIQAIYKDMQDNNIDRNAFLAKTEAGDAGTAKVNKGRKRHAAEEIYNPEITSSGLNKGTKLVDYKPSMALSEIGLTLEQYNALREAKAGIESSKGNYNVRGGSSNRFSGAYQLGGDEIKMAAKVLGEKAPVTTVKGNKHPIATDAFLKDSQMQERYHEAFVVAQHRTLMNNEKYAAMNPVQRSETLGFAHNRGAKGTSDFLNTGKSKADASGTQPQKYADRVRLHMAGLQRAMDEDTGSKTRVASATTRPTASGEQPQQRPHPSEMFIHHQRSTDLAAKPYDPYTPVSSATVTPTSTTKEVFDRMRNLNAAPVQRAQPEMSRSVSTTPLDMPTAPTPAPEKNVMNMAQTPPDRPQREVVVDASLHRHSREFPTASLERAMGKARGFETGSGSDGHHHSTTSLGQ